MLAGLEAIDYLASSADRVDGASSSHWQKYHSTFKFVGNGFNGLQGFGGHGKSSVILSFAENLMQIPYRKMGGSSFFSFEVLAKEITKKQGRRYDLDVLRQALTISFFYEVAPNFLSTKGVCSSVSITSLTSILLSRVNIIFPIFIN